MKSSGVVAVLIVLAVTCSAELASIQQKQNTLEAPELGCVEASLTNEFTGSEYRSYVCAGPEGIWQNNLKAH